jgi:hypothetical protein
MTGEALCDHDVDKLLALTMPEERSKLHLTHDNVQAILNDTVYRHTLPGRLAPKLSVHSPADQCVYYLNAASDSPSDYKPIAVAATEASDGRWWLPLGYLLLCSSAVYHNDDSVESMGHEWARLAMKHGIRGIRLNTCGYSMNHGM